MLEGFSFPFVFPFTVYPLPLEYYSKNIPNTKQLLESICVIKKNCRLLHSVLREKWVDVIPSGKINAFCMFN